MKRIETTLPGVCILEPTVYTDERGFFFESYHQKRLAQLGIDDIFVQDNHSLSKRGTLRGLHYQIGTPQSKLCRVVRGEALDVAVDIRPNSPHFGKWVSVVLSDENRREIYIPAGFAHGFIALAESVEFLYKCSAFYSAADERGIRWNDPQLAVDWNITGEPLLSEKDRVLPYLEQVAAEHLPSSK